MTNYPSNSNKSKQEAATNQGGFLREPAKGSLGAAFADNLFDTSKHAVYGTFFPSVKDLIYNTLNAWIRGILYGRTGYPNPRNGYTPYNQGYIPQQQHQQTIDISHAASDMRLNSWKTAWDVVTFQNIGDAEACLYRIMSTLSQVGAVSVKDYLTYAGIRIDDYTASNYGWTENTIGNPQVKSNFEGGYFIKMTQPERIK